MKESRVFIVSVVESTAVVWRCRVVRVKSNNNEFHTIQVSDLQVFYRVFSYPAAKQKPESLLFLQ